MWMMQKSSDITTEAYKAALASGWKIVCTSGMIVHTFSQNKVFQLSSHLAKLE